MRLIDKKRLLVACVSYPGAKTPLEDWYNTLKGSSYGNLVELRKTYPHADQVGKATVFNIKGNDYRLITSIHYNTQTVFILEVLTHAEYSKETRKARWRIFD